MRFNLPRGGSKGSAEHGLAALPAAVTRAGSLARRAALALALVAASFGAAQASDRGGPVLGDHPRPGVALSTLDADAPMAVGAKLVQSGAVARLSFDVSAPLAANAYLLEAPDRVIVDLPQVNFQVDPAAGRPRAAPGALIKSFRFGLFAPGRSRIVIDLAGPAALVRVSTVSIAGGDPSRLTIELARSDRASFHKAALAAPVPSTSPPAKIAGADQPKASSLPVIVIDPGHGGIDPGATGNGVVEKNVVFDFAAGLADKLTATGRYTVVMTRTGDSFVSLGDRVRMARDANAALFVSVHADTLVANGAVTGATVYTASDKASDAEAARVAESENRADSAAGVDSSPSAQGVDDILFDLTRRETRTYAHLFQRTLVGYWQKIARLNKNPERAAGFMVLQAPDVPSVLLELGYLSSDKDVRNLTSPVWRDGATGSIVKAIDAFFAPRQEPPSRVSSGASDGSRGSSATGAATRVGTN